MIPNKRASKGRVSAHDAQASFPKTYVSLPVYASSKVRAGGHARLVIFQDRTNSREQTLIIPGESIKASVSQQRYQDIGLGNIKWPL
jgi:hypothetical protein